MGVAVKSSMRLYAISALVILGLGFALYRAHFDWAAFLAQLRVVVWWHVAAGVALIYGTYWLRAWRWAEFCRPMTEGAGVEAADPYGMTTEETAGTRVAVGTVGRYGMTGVSGREADPCGMTTKKILKETTKEMEASGVVTERPERLAQRRSPVRAREVLGAQFVGFTAVAIFGRLADLARPYLVAQRTRLAVSSQVAVYTVERMFDLGAAAVVFSGALAFTPAGLAHRDRFVRVGVGSLGATLFLAAFAVAVRLRGEAVAAWIGQQMARVSPRFAAIVEAKILDFRQGLRAISTVREFGVAAAISIFMWLMIGGAYWQTTHAFQQTPELAGLSFSRTMLLMAASLGGSLLQLPGLGWFTQIAATAAAMRRFFGAPIEAATACGAMLLCVTSLSIVPAGLLFARAEGIRLRDAGKAASGEQAT